MTPALDDVALLSRLVGFDTTSRNSNLELVDFVSNYLDRPGVRFSRNRSPDGHKANLVVELGPDGDDRRAGLTLSGHTDVVPADESEWTGDPFRLTERDGRLFGRGACDMKGFLALAINTVASLEPDHLAQPLALVFTYDEEVGLLGARHFCETWPDVGRLPRQAWIGEPTTMEVVGAHKGFVDLRVTFTGVSAHSGYPRLGRSAIEPAARAVVALAELRATMEGERPASADRFPDVPFVPLNVGRVAGGTAINMVPDRCAFDVCVRPLPGVEIDDLVERIRATVATAVGDAPFTLEVEVATPPMRGDRTALLYAALVDAVGQDGDRAVSYATDGGWLEQVGFSCVVFGPGDIRVAHKADEWIARQDLARAREVMDAVVRRFC